MGTTPVPSPEFLLMLTKVGVASVETTLQDLFGLLKLDDDLTLLDKIQAVSGVLEGAGVCLLPSPACSGDIGTVRVLAQRATSRPSLEAILDEIRRGESHSLEFKASLFYDWKRALHDPNYEKGQELRSAVVTHSSLKTIAAFLSSEGGILYLGMNDAGEPVGIEKDYLCVGANCGNRDKWELEFTSLITTRFKDGASIRDYIRIEFHDVDRRTVARVVVSPRTRLTFLFDGQSYRLYRRQGNRTMEVPFQDIEEFLELRRISRARAMN